MADSDLDHATAAGGATIYTFNLRNPPGAVAKAQDQKITLAGHDIIYNLIDAVERAAVALLPPVVTTTVVSEATVQQVFELTSKKGTPSSVAGCKVTSGAFASDSEAQVVRDGEVVHTGRVESLRHNKDVVKEINAGVECGVLLEGFSAFEQGDVIRSIRVDSRARTSLSEQK